MSKLGCPCGHVIVDQADALPFKAAIVRDQDAEALWMETTELLATFVAAVRDGNRAAWLAEHLSPEYPQDVDDAGVISDLLAGFQVRYSTVAYECEVCGRLLIRRAEALSFVPFSPDGGHVTHVLSSSLTR